MAFVRRLVEVERGTLVASTWQRSMVAICPHCLMYKSAEQPCPVDCVLSDWGTEACSVSCGGVRNRVRNVFLLLLTVARVAPLYSNRALRYDCLPG